MSYTAAVAVVLGSANAGLTLEAQIVDTSGANVGAVQTSIVEIGSGNYLANLTIADGQVGGVKFRVSGGGALKAICSLNPGELENSDVKTSTRASQTSLDAVDDYVDTEVAAIKAKTDQLNFTGTDVKATLDGETVTASSVTDKTGYSLSAGGVQAIWDALTSALTTAGSIGALIVSKLTALGASTVTVTSPVASTNAVSIMRGDDYSNSDGRSLEWTNADGTWPDLTGATITLTVGQPTTVVTKTGSVVTPSGANQLVRVELTHTDTTGLEIGTHRYDVQATLATSSRIVTLARGAFTVLEDVS